MKLFDVVCRLDDTLLGAVFCSASCSVCSRQRPQIYQFMILNLKFDIREMSAHSE